MITESKSDDYRPIANGALHKRIVIVTILQVCLWLNVISFFAVSIPLHIAFPSLLSDSIALIHGGLFLALLIWIGSVNSTFEGFVKRAHDRNDVSIIGEIIEVLQSRNFVNRLYTQEVKVMEAALASFLTQLGPEGITVLTEKQRRIIPYLLTRQNVPLVSAILSTIDPIADAEIRQQVRALAEGNWSAGWNEDIRQLASECLNVLEKKQAEENMRANLLRPAVRADDALLRPVSTIARMSGEEQTLLQPSQLERVDRGSRAKA